MMTFSEQCIQQGMEKGIQQGMEKGREEGMERGLIKVLEAKFGTVPTAVIERIQQLKADQLNPLFKKVFTCNHIEEILPPRP